MVTLCMVWNIGIQDYSIVYRILVLLLNYETKVLSQDLEGKLLKSRVGLSFDSYIR
jgi:hypothetical protein